MRVSLLKIIENYIDNLEVGETVRTNHTDCPAGEDTRQRLYITRKPDVILGYCHNCSNSFSRYVSPKDRYRESSSLAGAGLPTTAEYTQPILVDFNDKDNIPVEAEAWRIRAELSRNQCSLYNIAYVPEWNAIYIPFVNMVTKTVGHQLRPLHKRGGAKYINVAADETAPLGGLLIRMGATTLVIVEDYVSACHLHTLGYSALVNYGIQVKPRLLYDIPQHYKTIIVWLDNDNTVVKENAKSMFNILKLYWPNKDIKLVTNHAEPKKLPQQKVLDVLNGRT